MSDQELLALVARCRIIQRHMGDRQSEDSTLSPKNATFILNTVLSLSNYIEGEVRRRSPWLFASSAPLADGGSIVPAVPVPG